MQYPDTDTRDYSDWLPESAFRNIKVEQSEESQESETSDDSDDSEESRRIIAPKQSSNTASKKLKIEEAETPKKPNPKETEKTQIKDEQEDVNAPTKMKARRTPAGMSSKGRIDGILTKDDISQPKLEEANENKYIRPPTVFDAVAGRVGRGFPPLYDLSQIPPGEVADRLKQLSRPKQFDATFKKPLTADEVLFEDSGAPARYEEYDVYFANERELPHGGQGVLPESDGLKAIHEYSSSSYTDPGDPFSRSSTNGEPRSSSLRSMDETALIAFGILMEESARNLLGRKGHEAFVVNENSDSEQEDKLLAETPIATPSPRVPSPVVEAKFKAEADTKTEHGDVVEMAQIRPWKENRGQSGSSRKKAKKRKVGGLQSLGSQDKRLMKGFKTR